MSLTLTKITSTHPPLVTKSFTFENGCLKKQTVANVTAGIIQRTEIENASALASLLKGLPTNQCLVFGVAPNDADLTTEAQWKALGCPDDPLPRSKSVFSWSEQQAILLLDYDPGKEGQTLLDREQLIGLLYYACPPLRSCPLVWYPSASSYLYASERQLSGLKGQHIYIPVRNGTDIERAGKALNERLWAMGHGRFEVSSSGSLLERGIFDSSVWQSNRIDFAAGAQCGEGLEQRRGEPYVQHGDEQKFLDTRNDLPDLSEEEIRLAQATKERSRLALTARAAEVRRKWMEERSLEILTRNPGVSKDRVLCAVRRAVGERDLTSDWPLHVMDGNGSMLNLTVADALKDPDRYDGLLTLDPLEPDYDGSRLVGKLFLKGARQNLFSFAHGGVNFRLYGQPIKIGLHDGKSSQAVDDLLHALRQSTDIYDFGSDLVRVDGNGGIHLLNESSLRYYAGLIVQFYKTRRVGNGVEIEVLCDPHDKVCKSVIALQAQRNLKKLNGVITAPTLRLDGSILQAPGYDEETQLLCDIPSTATHINNSPSIQEALKALESLMYPFRDFPFCGPLDRAVFLAALLTAAVRPVLPLAPGFAFDAPSQGSGKTLLARCIASLMQGSEPSVWPHTAGRDDEEIRKRIFSALRAGLRVLIWDNITGVFDSPSMAACMTSPVFTDRILGQSISSSVPNKLMIIFTGNNVLLQGEMPRRILVSRIDPAVERPFARKFDLDPFSHCRDNRQHLIASTLTLLRAYLTHGCSTSVHGSLASFEDWDKWVRRAVIFADELMPGSFGDVMECITANQSIDPDLEVLVNLLRAWHNAFQERAVSVSDLLRKSLEIQTEWIDLLNAINDLPLSQTSTSPSYSRAIGKYLAYRKDRIVGGYKLEAGPKCDDRNTWRVRRVGADM
jgi:hypothetical protein